MSDIKTDNDNKTIDAVDTVVKKDENSISGKWKVKGTVFTYIDLTCSGQNKNTRNNITIQTWSEFDNEMCNFFAYCESEQLAYSIIKTYFEEINSKFFKSDLKKDNYSAHKHYAVIETNFGGIIMADAIAAHIQQVDKKVTIRYHQATKQNVLNPTKIVGPKSESIAETF